VQPAHLPHGNWHAFRRRDGKGFPEEEVFYNMVFVDITNLPKGFDRHFCEVNASDPVHLEIIDNEWMLQKPITGVWHLHLAVASTLILSPGVPNPMSMPQPNLTPEQQRIVSSPMLDEDLGVVRVIAAAGSGKTSTLLAVAEAVDVGPPRHDGWWHVVYAVFNRSMQEEADHKFKGTFVDCRTWDAIAYKYVQLHFNGGAMFEIVDDVEVHLSDPRERCIWKVVKQFCQSDDLIFGIEHLQRSGIVDGKEANDPWARVTILAMARDMYERAARLDSQVFPTDHGIVFKMCQLDMARSGRRFTNPAARLFLCDEFQDVNPAQAFVARAEARMCPVVMVGDPGQSIYGFRGACAALSDFKEHCGFTYHLQSSFRFGTRLAVVANSVQSLHKTDVVSNSPFEVLHCTGVSDVSGVVTFGNFPDKRPTNETSYAVICLSNRQVLTLALELLNEQADVGVELVGEPLRQEVSLYQKLMADPFEAFEYQSRFVLSLRHAKCLADTFKSFGDFALSRALDMIKKHGKRLNRLIHNHNNHPTTVTFCTVQQAKGKEWDCVVLGHGSGVEWGCEVGPGVGKKTHNAVDNFYVAVTRARRHLYMPEQARKLVEAKMSASRDGGA